MDEHTDIMKEFAVHTSCGAQMGNFYYNIFINVCHAFFKNISDFGAFTRRTAKLSGIFGILAY